MGVTGIHLYRLVEADGWQMAIEIMRIRNHPSHIWEWSPNLQLFEYTEARNYLMGGLNELLD